jgi:CO/xanthine dehydrogenase FAD-binding subunit
MIKPFGFIKPKTVEEALSALQVPNSVCLAGGSDLLVEMRNGLKSPDLVVDIKGLEEAGEFSFDPRKGITIGAGVSLNFLAAHKGIRESCPALAEAAVSIGSYQIRNRATLVGNICNASPAADMAPVLYILGAEIVIAGPQGERTLPISSFMTGVKQNALSAGEFVIKVNIPPLPRARMAFMKKQRVRGHDLALINAAGLADADGKLLRICVGACAVRPVLLEGTDELYRKEKNPDKLAEAVAGLASASVSPIDDVRASAEYRRDLVRVFARRIVKQVCAA